MLLLREFGDGEPFDMDRARPRTSTQSRPRRKRKGGGLSSPAGRPPPGSQRPEARGRQSEVRKPRSVSYQPAFIPPSHSPIFCAARAPQMQAPRGCPRGAAHLVLNHVNHDRGSFRVHQPPGLSPGGRAWGKSNWCDTVNVGRDSGVVATVAMIGETAPACSSLLAISWAFLALVVANPAPAPAENRPFRTARFFARIAEPSRPPGVNMRS